MVQRPVRHSGTLYVRGMAMCMAHSTARFNNVSLCSLIFIPTIRLLRSRVLNAVGLPVGCANHYTTRASRYEVSNIRTIVVHLHYTQVSNSCRKWHIIPILVLFHSPLYTWRIPLFDELSVFQSFHLCLWKYKFGQYII